MLCWFDKGPLPRSHNERVDPSLHFASCRVQLSTFVHRIFSHRTWSGAAVKPRFHEWFSRGLVEGQHYLEVPAEPLDAICPALVAAMLTTEGSGSVARPAARRLVSAPQHLPTTSTTLRISDGSRCVREFTRVATVD